MTHLRIPFLALAALVPPLLGACSAAPERPPEPDGAPGVEASEPTTIVLAYVDGQALTLQRAMDAFLESHGGGHQVLVRGEPAVRELAGRLVEQQLFFAEASALGIPDEETVVSAVKEHRLATAEMVFWQREVDEHVAVSEEDVEAFYLKSGEALELSIVTTDRREAAEGLRARVVAGEDLADLASAESSHPSRSFGGLMPFVQRGDLELELERVAFELTEPGELSSVLPCEDGWAFLRLERRTVNAERPDRSVMLPRIRNILEDRQEDELRAAAEERVLGEAGVKIEAALLAMDVLLGDTPDEELVARSGDESIDLGDLRATLDLDAISRATAEEVDPVLVDMVAAWALREAVRAEAQRSGLIDDPEVVRKAQAFQREASLSMLYRDYVYADLELTEEDVRAYYEANKQAGFTRPAELHLAWIVTEEREQALELMQRVEAGESLEVLAREHSIDPASAMTGGRAQWLRPGQILPEVEEVAFALQDDELGGPVETPVGHFVLQVFERKPEQLIPFQEARRVATQRLNEERKQAAYEVWVERLRERASIELNDPGIRLAAEWLDREALAAEAEAAAAGPAEPSSGPQPPPGHGTGGMR